MKFFDLLKILLLSVGSFIAGTLLVLQINNSLTPFPKRISSELKQVATTYDILIAPVDTNEMILINVDVAPGYTNSVGWQINTESGDFSTFKASVEINEPKDENNLNYAAKINYQISENEIYRISIPNIQMPMAVRTQRTYAKFAGTTSGPSALVESVTNKTEKNAYAALMVGYDSDYHDVDVEALGVKTDWLLFWDEEWNFYHLDKTDVADRTPYYFPHTFLSMISAANSGTFHYLLNQVSSSNNAYGISFTDGSRDKQIKLKKMQEFEVFKQYPQIRGYVVTQENEKGKGILLQMDFLKY